MTPTANIKTLLKHYSSKKNTFLIGFAEFCDYMHRYAQKYVEDQIDLLPYVQNTQDAVNKNLEELILDKSILVLNPDNPKKAIVVVQFFIDKYAITYKNISNDPTLPFPMSTDLPKYITGEIYIKKTPTEYVTAVTDEADSKNQQLFGVSFGDDIPIMLIPSTVPIALINSIMLTRVRLMLRREEHHDYFLKKLRVANPGKELSVKTFFDNFVSKPLSTDDILKNSGENFYYWGQLCHFIKQDYEKLKDMTHEDICVLQAIGIIEVVVAFYRSKSQANQKKTDAFKCLDQTLQNPPYYYSATDIAKFSDQKGIPLLGQYSQEDLNEWLHEKTTTLESGNLPGILIFKTRENVTYFIKKGKVIPLIIKMSADARDMLNDLIKQEWITSLKNFQQLPEMKDQEKFENRLKKGVEDFQPVLHAILNSNFLSLINFEMQNSKTLDANRVNLFINGALIPYSQILMLSRQEIMDDIKIILPFWYTSPFISKIIALFLGRKKDKQKSKEKSKSSDSYSSEDDDIIEAPKQTKSPKEELKDAASKLEKSLVPSSSSLSSELKVCCNRWNDRIGKPERENLTEDVNSLIRDYLRRSMRTLKGAGFDSNRIEEMADSLVTSKELSPIKDKEALHRYVKLYILHLIKNIK